MCKVCKMSLDDEEAVFEAIELRIKNGANPEHFQSILDKLLGTEMGDRDEEAEEAWESNRKKNG